MLTLILAWTLAVIAPANQPVVQDEQKPPRYIKERQFQLKDLQVEELLVGEVSRETGKQDHKLKTWVMDTDPKRAEGLMFVLDGDMDKDQAMIFVFQEPEVLHFWMKNTYIPLDIAYIDQFGVIQKTYTMLAFDTFTDYTSVRACKYALEMKQGTIKRLGMKVGQKVVIPEKVKAKE